MQHFKHLWGSIVSIGHKISVFLSDKRVGTATSLAQLTLNVADRVIQKPSNNQNSETTYDSTSYPSSTNKENNNIELLLGNLYGRVEEKEKQINELYKLLGENDNNIHFLQESLSEIREDSALTKEKLNDVINKINENMTYTHHLHGQITMAKKVLFFLVPLVFILFLAVGYMLLVFRGYLV